MYLTRSEYDRGVNTFSPEGRLFQVSVIFLFFLGAIRKWVRTNENNIIDIVIFCVAVLDVYQE
jgi:20S proteasome subunit alpha 5